MKTKTRAAMLVTALMTLSGCSGHDMSFSETQDYFATRQPDLQGLMAMVEKCQPFRTDAPGYSMIRLSDGPGKDPVCVPGRSVDMAAIKSAMRKANLVMLNPTVSPIGQTIREEFIFYGEGLGVSGGGTMIYYSAAETDADHVILSRDQEVRALDDAPHHWFWIKT